MKLIYKEKRKIQLDYQLLMLQFNFVITFVLNGLFDP